MFISSLKASFFACLVALSHAFAAEQVRVVAVKPTPEPETVSLYLAFPRDQAMLTKTPVRMQVRVEGYPLGTDSQFDRRSEIVNSKKGQTLHVVIDDLPYFAVNEAAVDPFKEQGNYYVLSYRFEIPFSLDPGMHTIRMFPARSYGEALKGEKTFVASTFYLDNNNNPSGFDLSKPYVTYNEPGDLLEYTADKPILLDFYLSNCELSPDGYRIRVTLDRSTTRELSSWQPYYIYGLKSGKHSIELDLINSKGQVVPGPFNSVNRTIVVK